MKVIVFGASGNVGRLIVREAMHRGYDVTAVVFGSPIDIFGDSVSTVQLDVHDKDQVARALGKQEVVISALGSWGTKTEDIVSSGIGNIIPAMKQLGISRIISLTGAEARIEGDKPSLSSRFLGIILRIISAKVFYDGENHISLLQKSELDWTVVRSPRMKDGPTSRYNLNDKSPNAWSSITRKTVAEAMLNLAESNDHLGEAPLIHEMQ